METRPPAPASPKTTAVSVEMGGETHVLEVDAGETIFAAALRAGLCPPFSCVAGVCGECIATLDSGEVDMKSNRALSPKQLARGLILACQARPLGADCHLRFGDWPRRE